MDILIILIPLALLLGLLFIGSFLWATHQGQYDDLETPARKILFDEENLNRENTDHTILKKERAHHE